LCNRPLRVVQRHSNHWRIERAVAGRKRYVRRSGQKWENDKESSHRPLLPNGPMIGREVQCGWSPPEGPPSECGPPSSMWRKRQSSLACPATNEEEGGVGHTGEAA